MSASINYERHQDERRQTLDREGPNNSNTILKEIERKVISISDDEKEHSLHIVEVQ